MAKNNFFTLQRSSGSGLEILAFSTPVLPLDHVKKMEPLHLIPATSWV